MRGCQCWKISDPDPLHTGSCTRKKKLVTPNRPGAHILEPALAVKRSLNPDPFVLEGLCHVDRSQTCFLGQALCLRLGLLLLRALGEPKISLSEQERSTMQNKGPLAVNPLAI